MQLKEKCSEKRTNKVLFLKHLMRICTHAHNYEHHGKSEPLLTRDNKRTKNLIQYLLTQQTDFEETTKWLKA